MCYPARVTRLAGRWSEFFHVNAEGGVPQLTGMMFLRAFSPTRGLPPPCEQGLKLPNGGRAGGGDTSEAYMERR